MKNTYFKINFIKTNGLKISTIVFYCLLFFSSQVSAVQSDDALTQGPAEVIKSTLNKIATFSQTETKANPEQLRAFISQEITPNFDFNNMAHWITGRYANQMSAQDKVQFKRSLQEVFLSSLAKHLGNFDVSQTRFKVYRAYYRAQDEAFVSVSINRPYMPTIKLHFRLRQGEAQWKIIDVKANGFSAVLYYRRYFMQQLRGYQKNR